MLAKFGTGQWGQALILIVLGMVVYLTGLGATRLWDDDETYFAQTAREMYERGDLIVPWFNQDLFAHKPPFMYWMMIAAYKIFGVNEFAARFPSAIFAIVSALLVWRLGRILYSPRVGFWAGIILTTSLNYVVIARAATCDAELLFFCTLPIYLFVRGSVVLVTKTVDSAALNGVWLEKGDSPIGQSRFDVETQLVGEGQSPFSELVWLEDNANRLTKWKTWMQIYAAMGVAVMVKGPIGVVLPTAVLGFFLLLQNSRSAKPLFTLNWFASKDGATSRGHTWLLKLQSAVNYLATILSPGFVFQTIWSMRPLTAIVMTLLVAGPWFTAVSLKTHGEFLQGFFGVHHFHRFTAGMDNHAGPVYFYLLAICVGFFPWIIFLKPACEEMARRMNDPNTARPADKLLIAWCTVWIGFFSLAVTKFPHYVLPAYPALALGTAGFVDRWIREGSIYPKFWRRTAWSTVALVGVGIMIAMPFVAKIHLPGESWLGLAGLPLVAGALVVGWFAERGQTTRALASLTVTAGAFFIGLFAVAAVRVDSYQNTPPFAAAIQRRDPAHHARIGVYQCFRPGFVYYCNDKVEQVWEDASAEKFLAEDAGRAFLITTEADYQRLAEHLPSDVQILERSPWFLKSGETLVLLGSSPRNEVLQTSGANERILR